MSKQWSSSEINYLKRFAASKRLDELAQRFDTDVDDVKSKLAELKLASKEGPVETSRAEDPLVGTYEKAFEAMYKGDWKKAVKGFEEVLADSDLLDLTGNARQYLAVCRERLSDEESQDSDPFTAAVFHKNRGELDDALAVIEKKGDGKDERFVYLTASIHSLSGEEKKAVEALKKAIELNEQNRVHAFHDPDFAGLRENQEYAHLFGLA